MSINYTIICLLQQDYPAFHNEISVKKDGVTNEISFLLLETKPKYDCFAIESYVDMTYGISIGYYSIISNSLMAFSKITLTDLVFLQ